MPDITSSLFDEPDERTAVTDAETVQGMDEIISHVRDRGFSFDHRFFLKTEAYLLQLAYANNKILSLSNSRTRILAHQVESTHRIVNSLNKRFLVADEVGLGKTIEAGLVIKEFIYRYNYRRILIVCPASLQVQWQQEMASKFNESFMIMDRKGLSVKGREEKNPWKMHDKVICSLDFIKNSAFADDLKKARWDTIVFDEAHRLRRDSKKGTQAYVVGEILAEQAKALLLLTATPFRGNLEELYFLISLVDQNLLGPFNSFYTDYCMDNADLGALKEKISQVIIRRTKKEVGGFTMRHARTVRFELYPDERLLYDETTHYVVEEFNRAMQYENRAVGFVMTVFQKLLDSSSRALHMALRNRRERLSAMVERAMQAVLIEKDFSDYESDDNEDAFLEGCIGETAEKTIEELKEEIRTISRLIQLAEKIESDKKGEKLKELLKSLKKRGIKKFLIFTQFRTTQDYLGGVLSGFTVEIFNGSMDRNEKEEAIIRFKEESEILIATEAGGEGRNMQFCNVLINYDLPWSPLKIEQRIGRVHRFGQKDDVYIYNFSTRDTVAERVLEVLTRKLKLFEESIGSPDIMLGEIEDEVNLNSLIMDMASGRRSRKSVDREIDQRLDLARKSYEKLGDLTVTDYMDFNYDEYYRITLKERQFSNQRIEHFVSLLGNVDSFPGSFMGRKNQRTGLYPLRADNPLEVEFSPSGTFESVRALENENVEFLAFGHPIVDEIMSHCRKNEFGGLAGIILLEYARPFRAVLFNFIVTYYSKTDVTELVPVIVELDGVLDSFDLEDLESEVLEMDFVKSGCGAEPAEDEEVCARIEDYCGAAEEKLREKINRRVDDLSASLDLDIYPEMEKIERSYSRKIEELEEKLSIQEGKMKWQGGDMKGAITRTVRQIQRARRERDALLKKHREYLGITTSVRLLNTALVKTC